MSQFIVVDGINTTLADAVTTTDTSITLASSANLPTLLAGQIIPLIVQSASNASAYEIMYGTAISGAEITVTRGMEGTTAQAFNVGDYVVCGPTAGSNALIRAVMNPAVSMTLPQAYGAAVMPSGLSAAITLTLPNAVPAGTSYVIYGDSSYAVTADVSVTSGSPYIALPDGSTVYSWTVPADASAQGLRLVFDGTNWRAQTFGQTVVAPAAAGNQALPLGQAFQLIEPTDSTTVTPTALRTVVMPNFPTAPMTVTVEPGTVVGQEVEVFGNSSYAVTVSSNVTSGSPSLFYPDGSTNYSWTFSSTTGASDSIKMRWDGANWRCFTTGQTIVDPATQSNAAPQLNQLQNGSLNLNVSTGVFSNIQVITSTENFTVPDGVYQLKITVLGGGGGGGPAEQNPGAGGGGGAGGWASGIYSVTPGTEYTATIGGGGAGGGAANNGSTGGTTSFGSLLSATGGVGGYSAGTDQGSIEGGGAGGNGTGGDINAVGQNGFPGTYNPANIYFSGPGGSSNWGAGGAESTGTAKPASGYGSGGGGGANGQAGGDGSNGLIIVEW